jgi:hypothetical protein
MARLLGRAQSAGVRHGGDQLTAGAGERRCGGETPASRALRGGTLDCPARPFGDSALMPGARPGSACAARRRCAPGALEEGRKPGACSTKGYLAAHGTSGTGGAETRTIAGNMRGAWRPTPTDRGHRQPKTRGTAEGLPAWLSSRQGERAALPPAATAVLKLGPGCWMPASQPGLVGNHRTGGGNSGRFSV